LDSILLVQVVLGGGLWISLAVYQGYDFDWDVLNYHFYNGFAFIHGKTWTNQQVAMRQTYFAPLMDSAYYLLVRHMAPTLVVAVVAAVQSLLYPMLFQISRRLLQPWFIGTASLTAISMLLALLGMVAPVNIWEAGGALGDTSSAVLVIAAVLVLVESAARNAGPVSVRSSLALGALSGLAAGLKLTNLPFAIGVLAALVTQLPEYRGSDRLRRYAIGLSVCATALAGGFAMTYGWWGIVLYHHLGNPVFPSFNQVFQSPFAAPSSFTDPAFALPTWRDKVMFAFTRTSISGKLDPAGLFDLRMACSIPICLIGLVFTALRLRERALVPGVIACTGLWTFILVSYIGWLFVFPINRYLVAADMLAPIGVVAAAICVGRRAAFAWGATIGLAVILPLSAMPAWPMYWLPGEHRSGDKGGYFGVQFIPPPSLDRGLVAMLGGYPTTFLIPFFPRQTQFVRLQGSLYYESPGFYAIDGNSGPKALRATMDNAMSQNICRALDEHQGPLFVLRPMPEDTPQDRAVMNYFGISYDHTACEPVATKSTLTIGLCAAHRLTAPLCDRAAGG
jgi:hypothetical protein